MALLSGYKLTFDDEFNTLNAGLAGTPGIKWETEHFYKETTNGGQGTINPTPPGQPGSLYSVSNGVLALKVLPNSAPYLDTNPNGVPGGFSQQYGYFEMSAKLTGVSGYADAFWLMPNSGPWPPEIDIEEHDGAYKRDVYFTNHGGTETTPADNYNIYGGPDLSAAFHTYGLMWTPTTLTWYFDGIAKFSAPTAGNQHQPFNIIVSAYAHHGLGYTPDAQAGTTDTFYVDWVRAYSNAQSTIAITGEAGYSNHDGSISGGSSPPVATLPPPVATLPPPPTTHTLDLALSEDAWKGDAQFTVSVDGAQVGGIMTTNALHAAGASGHFKLTGEWGSGAHAVKIAFLNDAWGGTTTTDRNLYLDSVAYDGVKYAGTAATLSSNGSKTVWVGGSTPVDPASSDTLVLHMSEDAWRGDAKFQVSVDGKTINTAQAVTALHGGGAVQDFVFSGKFGTGPHDVGVTFLNDAWGGTPATDRNLYVNSIDFGSKHHTGGVLLSAGTQHFAL